MTLGITGDCEGTVLEKGVTTCMALQRGVRNTMVSLSLQFLSETSMTDLLIESCS